MQGFKSVKTKNITDRVIIYEEKNKFTEEEYDNAIYYSQITSWNLMLEALLIGNDININCDNCPRFTELLIDLWNTKGIENGELSCEFDGRDLNLLENYQNKIPTFIDKKTGKDIPLYRFNFIGMVINTTFRQEFQNIWQQWSKEEIDNGFPQNLIPLILPKKINKQIQKGIFKIVLTRDKRL